MRWTSCKQRVRVCLDAEVDGGARGLRASIAMTYAVKNGSDVSVRIKNCIFAAQLQDLADEHNVAADVVVEVLRRDAGCGGSFGHLAGCSDVIFWAGDLSKGGNRRCRSARCNWEYGTAMLASGAVFCRVSSKVVLKWERISLEETRFEGPRTLTVAVSGDRRRPF